MGKGRQIACWLLALTISPCADVAVAQGLPSLQEMTDQMTFGIRPPASVKNWFALISNMPRPPGGPKVYFMQEPARKPLDDRFAEYVLVPEKDYPALLAKVQSSGCDSNLRPPFRDFSLAKIPATTLSQHTRGRTREIVCMVSFGKACSYLKAIETLPGQSWPKQVRDGIAKMYDGLNC